jgi:hypothetical protein
VKEKGECIQRLQQEHVADPGRLTSLACRWTSAKCNVNLTGSFECNSKQRKSLPLAFSAAEYSVKT